MTTGPDRNLRPPRNQVFLEQSSYRRRRMVIALRLLPLLGVVLFLAPLLAIGVAAPGSTANAGTYLFIAWAVLIVLAAVLSRLVMTSQPASDDTNGDDEPRK